MNLPEDAVLVLIDFQQGFFDDSLPSLNDPDAPDVAADRPLVHVRHDSQEPDSVLRRDKPGFAWLPATEPHDGEYTVEKTVNGAFLGTPLDDWLRDHGYDTLLVCGLTTDHCVSTTVRMAENRGYDATVVADACATFPTITPVGDAVDAETSHQVALAHLQGEFATVVDASDLLS